jgi:hypothetical protein
VCGPGHDEDLARDIAEIEDALIKDRLNALAWLAAPGLLEVKLALRAPGQQPPGVRSQARSGHGAGGCLSGPHSGPYGRGAA